MKRCEAIDSLVLDQLEHVGADAADGADKVLGQLGRIDGDLIPLLVSHVGSSLDGARYALAASIPCPAHVGNTRKLPYLR